MDWLGVLGGDEAWERENPPISRRDWAVALTVMGLVAVMLELFRAFAPADRMRPTAVQYLMLAGQCLPLVARRRHPLVVALLGFLGFFVAATYVPELGYQTFTMAITFFALYSGTAWASDRRQAALVLGGLLVAMMVWVAWDVSMGHAIDNFREARDEQELGHGILPPLVSWILYSTVANLVYVLGAIAMGQSAWRQARDRALLERSARTIEQQSRELQEQAVVQERLRIARELHDVVAHHVSVMGIQAAGARRLLDRDPSAATQALENVEDSARQAVTQMRGLLGALRGANDHEAPDGPDESRDPQPSLAELDALVDGFRRDGLSVDLARVEHRPGALESLPLPVQLSLYRTVQEALSNVVRHSTATRASVTLRSDERGGREFVEAEVLDNGRPRAGTSGSGLGLLGMRERVHSHGGSSEIGPRVTGGYRVRVRFPITSGPATSTPVITTEGATA